ncbi:MAG: acylphosphatase [Elusimicrobia bacterium]|nr:acylphosphatase [Elusimicrobiota bacterium]
MADSLARSRFVVSGRVQGVGFRWFVQDLGRSLGLRGWVRNRPDGKVEAEAEGRRASLALFARELRGGPGRVDAVETEALPAQGRPEGFDIIL